MPWESLDGVVIHKRTAITADGGFFEGDAQQFRFLMPPMFDVTLLAVLFTSEPMITALKRLAKDNLSNLHPHPLYVWFYYSHPPLIERIEYLNAMNKEIKNT